MYQMSQTGNYKSGLIVVQFPQQLCGLIKYTVGNEPEKK
jgi:hypothetical protein